MVLSPRATEAAITEALLEAQRRRAVMGMVTWPDCHVIGPDGEAVPFHEYQDRAWNSDARFTFVFAGTQGGKTVFGPWWMDNEIKHGGRGDYLAVTSSFDLFKLKMLPEMRRVFEGILRKGRYWAGTKVIELCDPKSGRFYANKSDDPMWARIILRSARAEGGLEAATAKAAWLDECGMDEFTVDAWEAVIRRLSIYQGRVLGTTTLYNRGWIKSRIYDPWREGDPDINVIQFPSYINPTFPKEEFDRIVTTMPQWKVNMFYRGEFDIPAGLIYDCFDEELCIIDPFSIPDEWIKYGGIDFGGVNTGAICYAEDPQTKNLYVTKEYLEGGRTSRDHSHHLMKWGCKLWCGGSKSEGQWRQEFGAAGMPIQETPITDVEVGIDRVYEQHKSNSIFVFSTCKRYLDEKRAYSRQLDRDGNPTEKIRDKETFHIMDAERYIISKVRPKVIRAKAVRLA